MDFEKAFDSVSHNLLLLKLERFGITGPLLHLLSDFLSDRFQRVVTDGCQSDWAPVLSGVPQGSTLGPFLFILYVNDIPGFLSSPTVMFADDTLEQQFTHFNIHLNGARLWRLRSNVEKCKSMKFTRAWDPAVSNYTMANKQLEQVQAHKHLEYFYRKTYHGSHTYLLLLQN